MAEEIATQLQMAAFRPLAISLSLRVKIPISEATMA